MLNVRASQVLLERLISTNGLKVRKSPEDDAFWYTSGIPGPFYINTETIAGSNKAGEILATFDTILKAGLTQEQQASSILETVTEAVNADKSYEASIDSLLEYYLSQNRIRPFAVSGGERRDWFFSIPIAQKLEIPHLFLYKNGSCRVTDFEGKSIDIDLHNTNVLHVADIINKASSYLTRWIPILQKTGAAFSDTLSVSVRSQEGVNHLQAKHISVISPLVVDVPLFAEAYRLGLINEFAYNEIKLYYDSPRNWTRQFIESRSIDDSERLNTDRIKQERIQVFKSSDPYRLKNDLPSFFS